MATFPTGLTDRVPTRTSKVLGDTGTNNGNFSVDQMLKLFNLADLPPGTAPDDYPVWNGSAWVLGNDQTVAELSLAAAMQDTDQFAMDQGGASLMRAPLSALFTYMMSKFLAANAVIEEVTGTTYTITAADKNKYKRFTSGTAVVVNVPASLSVGFAVGWIQQGAGQLTFQSGPSAGQNIQSPAGLKSGAQHAAGRLLQLQANTWNLSGYTVV